jgi:uncharacterized membrane protein YccC
MMLFLIGALVGALIGTVSGGAFALRHLHLLRRGLATEMCHDLTDEFGQRFRHIENQLEYLESAIVHLKNDLDLRARTPLPGGRIN